MGYLAVYGAEIYELEVSYSSARCHYVDFRNKTITTGISVLGSQALGAERRGSPSLAVKVLKLPSRWENKSELSHFGACKMGKNQQVY